MKPPRRVAKSLIHERRTSNVQLRTRLSAINDICENLLHSRQQMTGSFFVKRWSESISAFDDECSMFNVRHLKIVLAGWISRRTGPNLFGSLGLSPKFNLLQLVAGQALQTLPPFRWEPAQDSCSSNTICESFFYYFEFRYQLRFIFFCVNFTVVANDI